MNIRLPLVVVTLALVAGCGSPDSEPVDPAAVASAAASAAAAQAAEIAEAVQAAEESAAAEAEAEADAKAEARRQRIAAKKATAERLALRACERWETGFNSISPKSGRAYTEAAILADRAARGHNIYARLVEDMDAAREAAEKFSAAFVPDAYGYIDFSVVNPLSGASSARNIQVGRACNRIGYTIVDSDGGRLAK